MNEEKKYLYGENGWSLVNLSGPYLPLGMDLKFKSDIFVTNSNFQLRFKHLIDLLYQATEEYM